MIARKRNGIFGKGQYNQRNQLKRTQNYVYMYTFRMEWPAYKGLSKWSVDSSLDKCLSVIIEHDFNSMALVINVWMWLFLNYGRNEKKNNERISSNNLMECPQDKSVWSTIISNYLNFGKKPIGLTILQCLRQHFHCGNWDVAELFLSKWKFIGHENVA